MKKEMCPIKIKDLKALAIKHDMQAIVLLTVERNGTVSVVTYGENVEKCKAIGDWGQGLWKHCVSLIPFQSVFGWGNNGVPMILPDECKDCQYLNLSWEECSKLTSILCGVYGTNPSTEQKEHCGCGVNRRESQVRKGHCATCGKSIPAEKKD